MLGAEDESKIVRSLLPGQVRCHRGAWHREGQMRLSPWGVDEDRLMSSPQGCRQESRVGVWKGECRGTGLECRVHGPADMGSRDGLGEGQGNPREKPKSDLVTSPHLPPAHPEGAGSGHGPAAGSEARVPDARGRLARAAST